MSQRAPGTTARCDCGEPIIFAQTRAGAVAPVVYNASPEGNVLVFRRGGKLNCRTFAGETLEALRAEGVPLRLNHFADCPQAAKFTRGKAAV